MHTHIHTGPSQEAQWLRICLPRQETQETRVWFLGWEEDPLEEETATHSSIRAWRIPWTEEPSRLQSMGSWRVRHNWTTEHSCMHTYIHTANKCAYMVLQSSTNPRGIGILSGNDSQAGDTSSRPIARINCTSACRVGRLVDHSNVQGGWPRLKLEYSKGHTCWVLEVHVADRHWWLTAEMSRSPNVPSFLLIKL